jgi:hypothetical protein
MFEATTNPNARNAMEEAHRARARAATEFWGWLFGTAERDNQNT